MIIVTINVESKMNDNNEQTELESKIKLVAEIFDFPTYQFSVFAERNEKLKAGIMRFSISEYQNIIDKINAMDEKSKFMEQAKLQRIILILSQEEVQAMCERMEDMYYR